MSFRLRIALMTIVVTAILFSIGGAALISTSFKVSVEKEEQTAVDNMSLMLRMLAVIGESGSGIGEESMTETLRRITSRSDFEAVSLVRRNDGTESPLAGKTLYNAGNTRGVPSPDPSRTPGNITVIYPSAEDAHPRFWTVSAFVRGTETYELAAARDLSAVYDVREGQKDLFLRIYLILLAAAAVFSYLLSTVLTRSLRQLSRASREIASGNLAWRSRIDSDDEIGALSQDFDRMAENLEENMERLKEEADRKERFMGAFTHELKTPMTSIIGYADLLRTQELTEEERDDALQYIFSEGKRLESMSLKLLDLFVADKNEIARREISPAVFLTDVTGHLAPVLEKARITTECDAQEGTCMADPDLLQTLFINLIDNARKAMPDGGTIRIRAAREDGNWHFSVADTGKGMEQEELAHITEAFYRVDKARARQEGSAGIGLALCDKIVALHGGTLTFESEKGVGTTVHILLPDADGPGEVHDEG